MIGAAAGWRRPRPIVLAAGLILFVTAATMVVRVLLWASIPYRGYGASFAIIEIPEGASAAAALEILEGHGIVQRFRLAPAYLRLTGRARDIKAGEYSFTRPMTPGEVFDKIVSGDVHYHRITVLEGSRADEVVSQFVRSGFGRESEYLEAISDVSVIADLDDEAVDLEGYLFPDTYSIHKKTPPGAIVAMMVARFREVFQQPWIEMARQKGLTVRQAVTLASLVERETAVPEENPQVASVFHNRLRLRMRLQCDPTVIYAMAMRDAYDGNIRREDLKIDSRYNTYRYSGLPPGPIGSPGAAALRAAVDPAETRYLYFVSMNTGRHFFSTTLGQHNRAVWEYQKKPFRVRRQARSRDARREN
jgi:UPF0755 protein